MASRRAQWANKATSNSLTVCQTKTIKTYPAMAGAECGVEILFLNYAARNNISLRNTALAKNKNKQPRDTTPVPCHFG